jgi:hypothetical protein
MTQAISIRLNDAERKLYRWTRPGAAGATVRLRWNLDHRAIEGVYGIWA